jgi:hypothetical protein
MQRLVTAIALVGVALAFLVLWRSTSTHAPRVVASWTLTPGVLNPDVRQETIGSTICTSGWTRTIRPPSTYTSALKLDQMREYGVGGRPSDYQEDHLVSLELGGHPTDPRNLWPEPRPHAEQVDRVENQLREQICSGEVTLADAQRRISEIKHRTG